LPAPSQVTSPAPVRGPDRPHPEPVSPRWRRLLPFAALALLIAGVTAYVQTLGWNTNTYTNDEVYSLIGGRLLEGDFFALLFETQGWFNRGPERLNSVIMALAAAVTGTAPDELRTSHVLLALIYFAAAVPTFALARGLGLGRGAAVLVAALTVVTPWALFGATLLNVTVGVPMTMLFAWAAWRTAVRPSLLNDAVTLAAAGLNTLARTGHAPFVVVALLAVVYAVWLRRPVGERAAHSLLRLPLRTLRTHPLLVAVMVLGGVYVLAVGSTNIAGPAYSSVSEFKLPWQSLWDHLRQWFVQLTMATGYLPMLLGLPWLLWQAVRPASRETGVFAVIALGLFVTFVYLTGNIFSAIEERYVAPLAAFPALAFGAAVFRREAWPLGTLLVGLVAARAIATVGIVPGSDFLYQVAPARLFFSEVVLGRVTVAVPGGDDNIVLIATLAMVALALAVSMLFAPAALRRWPAIGGRRQFLAVGACVPVLLLGALSGGYAMNRYKAAVLPDKSFERMAWIDEASGDRPTFLWAYFWPETRDGRIYMGQLAQHFNLSVCCTLWLNDVQDVIGPDGMLPGPPTPYLARFEGYLPLVFETEVVARSQEFGNEEMRVERFLGDSRAVLKVEGAEPDGAVRSGRPVTLRPLQAPRADRCLAIDLGSPLDAKRRLGYRIRAGGRKIVGTLRPTFGRRLVVPLDEATPITVESTRRSKDLLRLGELRVMRCR